MIENRLSWLRRFAISALTALIAAVVYRSAAAGTAGGYTWNDVNTAGSVGSRYLLWAGNFADRTFAHFSDQMMNLPVFALLVFLLLLWMFATGVLEIKRYEEER